MYDVETLLATLSGYCKWPTLPRQLLLDTLTAWTKNAAGSVPSSEATDEVVLEAFLQALSSAVPLEWSVSHHAAFTANTLQQTDQNAQQWQQQRHTKQQVDNRTQTQQQQASMHSQAVGTPYGIMTFGGLELGKLTELKVKSEVSWIKEHNGYMLQPDFSRVYQGSSSQHSKHVFKLMSDGKGGSWSAKQASPALPVGLIGHSAVLYGSRVFIFGGLEMFTAPVALDPEAPAPKPATHTSNKLRAYAVDEAGTQGGLLPVLSDLPQMGPQPSSRMYHKAAVDLAAGLMYVYGGVHIRDLDGTRWPADQEPGTLHCFSFHSYTWNTILTTGSCRPRSTTLLAFCWHKGDLWAIPDVAVGASSNKSATYKLLRLDLVTRAWTEVATQGQPPCLRTDSCNLSHNGQILIYGGKTAAGAASMLSDLHTIDLNQRHPTWKQIQPRLLPSSMYSISSNSKTATAAGSSNPSRPALLSLAGHCGGVDQSGHIVFWGGYQRNDLKEPQSVIQVLTQGVKPPTADAAQLTRGESNSLALALQHVRQQLARLVRQHHPQQVLLRPDGGGGVRLPARLLALYSTLFDDMFQEMLEEEDEDIGAGAAEPRVVPVPGASLEGVAGVCRWMMGLLALGSCQMNMLTEMYRVADRLIIERLMVEVLEVLGAADMTPQQATAVLQLTGDLSGRDDVAGLGAKAAQQLTQQVTVVTAPGIMTLALQMNNKQLQDRCQEVMMGHRKNNIWAVLEFACRFSLPKMQGSCLHFLSQLSRGRLIDHADRILKVATRFSQGKALTSLPTAQMLEKDLCLELSLLGDNLTAVTSYAAAAERLQLQKVRQGLVECCGTASGWKRLQEQKQVWQHMQQRFPNLAQTIKQKASTAQ